MSVGSRQWTHAGQLLKTTSPLPTPSALETQALGPFPGQSMHPRFWMHTPLCIYIFYYQSFRLLFKELLSGSTLAASSPFHYCSLCPFPSQPQAFKGAFIIVGCPWSPLECVSWATQSPISTVVEPFKSLFVLYVNDRPLRLPPLCVSQPPCSLLCFLPLDPFFLVPSFLVYSVCFFTSLLPCSVVSCMLFLNKSTHVQF